MDVARRTAEHVARDSYGRLIGILAARSRDIAASEDALAEALVSALRTWPDRGTPANPEAWLLTAARNSIRNALRHGHVAKAAAHDILYLHDPVQHEIADFPDERLKLMFVCAHPAIDPAARTPLMLQTILGLDAARIASAFLVSPAAMSQRLVRAKARIKQTGIRFEIPSADDMPGRLDEVLDAIYAAFGVGWDRLSGAEPTVRGLTDEAINLCRLLVSLLPEEPEARGLLALMLYCEARRSARRDAAGQFVPLARQDPRLWSRAMIVEAENLLISASRLSQFGRFQCEAAIQSVHVQRAVTRRTDYGALVTLYRMLANHTPSTGVLVGLAAVLVEAGQADEALRILDGLDADGITVYQPYWVTRASALRALDQPEPAWACVQTAIGLTEEESVRVFLANLFDAH